MKSDRLYLRNVIYFGVLHLLPFGALFTGADARVFVAAAALYWIRIWFVTAGYHCYFSHRAFQTGRVFQLILAIGAQASGQGSVLRWAAAHRYHHANSDHPDDLHSPHRRGLWHAHMGWLFRTRYLAPSEPRPGPFTRFPELVWLHRHPNVPPFALAALTLIALGWPGLFIAYGLSTVLVYHATFTVNSLAHRFGSRPYETPDQSRNNWFVAIVMLGGGWHNNHHRFPRSARQGLRWWEIDITYYVLVVLARLGVVRNLRVPRSAPLGDSEVRTPPRSRSSQLRLSAVADPHGRTRQSRHESEATLRQPSSASSAGSEEQNEA
jgi:stearoyl-CoA desaturase (delta-9 desaturase)